MRHRDRYPAPPLFLLIFLIFSSTICFLVRQKNSKSRIGSFFFGFFVRVLPLDFFLNENQVKRPERQKMTDPRSNTRRRWIRTTGTLIPHGFEVQALNPQSSST